MLKPSSVRKFAQVATLSAAGAAMGWWSLHIPEDERFRPSASDVAKGRDYYNPICTDFQRNLNGILVDQDLSGSDKNHKINQLNKQTIQRFEAYASHYENSAKRDQRLLYKIGQLALYDINYDACWNITRDEEEL